jgi:hypothetical protein
VRYHEPGFESREVTVAAVRNGSSSEICNAVIGASLATEDPAWVEALCVDLAASEDEVAVKAAAVLALAHLARRFHALADVAAVTDVLAKLDDVPELTGPVGDLRDDLAQFLRK